MIRKSYYFKNLLKKLAEYLDKYGLGSSGIIVAPFGKIRPWGVYWREGYSAPCKNISERELVIELQPQYSLGSISVRCTDYKYGARECPKWKEIIFVENEKYIDYEIFKNRLDKLIKDVYEIAEKYYNEHTAEVIKSYRRKSAEENSGKSYIDLFNEYLKKYGKGSSGVLTAPFKKISDDLSGHGFQCYSAPCNYDWSLKLWLDTEWWMIHLFYENDVTGRRGREFFVRFLYDGDYGTPTYDTRFGPKSFEDFKESMDYEITDAKKFLMTYNGNRDVRMSFRKSAVKTPSKSTVKREVPVSSRRFVRRPVARNRFAYKDNERVDALAKYLNVTPASIRCINKDKNLYETPKGRYKVLTDEESVYEAQDIVNFKLERMGLNWLPENMQRNLEEAYEDNDPELDLDIVEALGCGELLSTNGEEIDLGDYLYAYKVGAPDTASRRPVSKRVFRRR